MQETRAGARTLETAETVSHRRLKPRARLLEKQRSSGRFASRSGGRRRMRRMVPLGTLAPLR